MESGLGEPDAPRMEPHPLSEFPLLELGDQPYLQVARPGARTGRCHTSQGPGDACGTGSATSHTGLTTEPRLPALEDGEDGVWGMFEHCM